MERATNRSLMPCEEWDAYGWDDEAEEYDASPLDNPDDYLDEADE